MLKGSLYFLDGSWCTDLVLEVLELVPLDELVRLDLPVPVEVGHLHHRAVLAYSCSRDYP